MAEPRKSGRPSEEDQRIKERLPSASSQAMKGGPGASSSSNLFIPNHSRNRSTSGRGSELIDWTPFVARHVRTLYHRRDGAALGEAKMYVRPFAVVAMADISGYTKLTTTLAKRGDEGAENLTKILNPYLQFMVDIVEKSGGDIIKFIGDAILIAWVLKGSREETVASACWGCTKLVERLGDHHVEIPGDEKFLLSMHIGLSVGETFDVHVGTEERMEYFLAGRAVKEAVYLVNVAEVKQIAITGEALSYLEIFKKKAPVDLEVEGRTGGIILKRMEIAIDPLNPGHVTYNFSARNAPEPPPPRPIYQRYINESVVNRLSSKAGFEFESASVNELRKVVVLFVKIVGVNAHASDSLGILQSTMEVVLGVLKKYDGTLRQMVIDDKGATLLTVFGLPPFSHENNSIFGVRAALELQSLLKHLVSFSIGLTTGAVFSGVIGSRKRCDHTILGEPVNLAARMMCSPIAAGGGILCDTATMKATKEEIEFSRNDPQKFFKNSEPIECFTVLRQRKAASKTPHPTLETGRIPEVALIGREEEIKTIKDSFGKFLETWKSERALIFKEAKEEHESGKRDKKEKESRYRRKGSVPTILRSTSFNIGNSSKFQSTDIPRIILEGDGGFGKSSLLAFIRDLAKQNGLSICAAKADEVDKSTPYYVFRDILTDIFDMIIGHFDSQTPETPSEVVPPQGGGAPPEPRGRLNSSPNLAKGAENFLVKQFLGNAGKSKSSQAISATIKVKNNRNVMAQLQDEAARSDFSDKAALCFGLLGIEPNLFIHLAPIFPILNSVNDKVQEKKDIAIDVVSRIFERFSLLIAPLAITIDDAHWMDSYSYKLIWVLVRRCSGVFLALGSRAPSVSSHSGHMSSSPSVFSLNSVEEDMSNIPITNVRNSILVSDTSALSIYNKIKHLTSSKTLSLKGISREAVEKLIIYHSGFPCRSIQDRLLNEIVKRTGSNPLFVERIAASMKGKAEFGVTPSGELIIKGSQGIGSSPFDGLDWGEDPETAVLVQFDRLPSDIQLFLRAASVMGQSFTIEMVCEILDNRVRPQEAFETITGFPDVFGFIGWEEPDFRDKSVSYRMFFKSAVLQKCIYLAMLTEQRQELHYKIARIYEHSLNNANISQLLPLISFHYSHSKDLARKIQSLDDVSTHYIESGAYPEAIASLTKLFELLEKEREKDKEDKRKDRSARADNLSRYHMLLGTAYVGKSEYSKGQKHLFTALAMLNFEFPESPLQVKLALWKNYQQQRSHWNKRHDAQPTITDPAEVERVCQLCGVLNALSTSFNFVGSNQRAELCLLLQLNFCEALGLENAKENKLHFGQIEADTAMLFWMRNKRSLSMEYFGRAKSICEYSESVEDLQHYYTLRSTMLLSSGRIKESLECLNTVLALHKKHSGGISGSHAANIDLSLISLLDGEFEQHRENVTLVYEAAIDSGDVGTQLEAACTMIQNLLLAPPHFPEGTTDVTNWVLVAEEMYESWGDARSSNVHLLDLSATLFLYYSFKSADKARTYCDQFLKVLLKSESRLVSPLGYLVALSIFFFLLAQHRMYTSRYELKEKIDWKVQDAAKAISAVLKALLVLEQWWSFATPIISLARGLLSLYRGKSKAAVSAWRRGIKTTDEISDNLKFLKSALQVRVVRYCQGDDAMRMEVSEFLQKIRARTELSLLAAEAFSPLPIIVEEEDDHHSSSVPLS